VRQKRIARKGKMNDKTSQGYRDDRDDETVERLLRLAGPREPIHEDVAFAAQAVLDDNTITSHVKRIRRKFQSIDADFAAIETVYGMGYRWIAD
jgi:DNA-binding response OmpR family regulator